MAFAEPAILMSFRPELALFQQLEDVLRMVGAVIGAVGLLGTGGNRVVVALSTPTGNHGFDSPTGSSKTDERRVGGRLARARRLAVPTLLAREHAHAIHAQVEPCGSRTQLFPLRISRRTPPCTLVWTYTSAFVRVALNPTAETATYWIEPGGGAFE